MGTQYTNPEDWMLNAGGDEGSVKLTDKGWVKVWPNGLEEVIHAAGGYATVNVTINANESRVVEAASYQASVDPISFSVEMNEVVDVLNTAPNLQFTVGAGSTQLATYASGTGTNVLVFTLATLGADLGDVAIQNIVQVTDSIIEDVDNNAMVLPFDASGTLVGPTVTVTA